MKISDRLICRVGITAGIITVASILGWFFVTSPDVQATVAKIISVISSAFETVIKAITTETGGVFIISGILVVLGLLLVWSVWREIIRDPSHKLSSMIVGAGGLFAMAMLVIIAQVPNSYVVAAVYIIAPSVMVVYELVARKACKIIFRGTNDA